MTDSHIKHLRVTNLYARYRSTGEFVSKNISFEVKAGEIMAIMGPSGSGKSTLLRAVMGQIPCRGSIYVNGEDVTETGLACVSARVGLVPQDDILIDELTVLENIKHFHTVAVDSKLNSGELHQRIIDQLTDLGIDKVAHSRVGVYGGAKNISGGQRKRANIAMELVNEPDILIIDEPTSGLSSQDSLELVRSLRGIANSGKIVIIIIHQPSSEIFKQFDRLLLLDGKGYCIRSGLCGEVLKWFREKGGLEGGSCDKCSSYFPEKLLEAVEKTKDWQSASEEFSQGFLNCPSLEKAPVPKNRLLRSPLESIKDFVALVGCQIRIRMRDRMSQLVTLVAPPFLGLIMSIVFKSTPEGKSYAFQTNELYPQALFMLMIGAMFLALVSSVSEVIKDRPIVQREVMRGLSLTAYYFSELANQVIFCAIQAALLVAMAMHVLEATNLFWPNFVVMYGVMLLMAAFGLLVSMLFKSQIAAYNMIPLILIPQIILGGALLAYKDMGAGIYLWEKRDISRQPPPASWMPASWGYELALRLSYEKMQSGNSDRNQAIMALAKLPQGAFLSPYADRLIDKDWQAWLPGKPYHDKALAEDAWVLALLLLGLTGTGVIWIRREYRNSIIPLLIGQCLLLSMLYLAYTKGMKPAPTNTKTVHAVKAAKAPRSYLRAPQAMGWENASNFCKAKGYALPTLVDLVVAFNQDKSKSSGVYWTGESVSSSGGARKVWVARFDLPTGKNAPSAVPFDAQVMRRSGAVSAEQNMNRALGVYCIKEE